MGTRSLWGRQGGRASAGWNGIGGVGWAGWAGLQGLLGKSPAVCIPSSAPVSSVSGQLRARRLLGLRASSGFVVAVFSPSRFNGDGPFPRSTFPCLREVTATRQNRNENGR